ncbi:MAG: c-type cytochrome [Acidobacteria bacterium]|nr:c-type cytochrome [Acidobacteriota bacterium]
MNWRAIKWLLVLVLIALPLKVTAQNERSIGVEEAGRTKEIPTFKVSPNLNDQEKRGQHWFFQRCALCHVAKVTKSASVSALPPIWSNLDGVYKNATPEKEKLLREFILKGSQKMPGYQYTLSPQEIDDVIAYMKTL